MSSHCGTHLQQKMWEREQGQTICVYEYVCATNIYLPILKTRNNVHLYNPPPSPVRTIHITVHTSSTTRRKHNGSVGHRSHFRESLISAFSGGDNGSSDSHRDSGGVHPCKASHHTIDWNDNSSSRQLEATTTFPASC